MTQPIGVNFDQAVRDSVMQILGDPIAFPEVFKSWVTGWIEANPPTLPIAQITGFSQYTVAVNTQTTASTTTSITYADLADGQHPSLSNLPDGKYELRFGSVSTGTGVHKMGLSVNGAAVTSDLEIQTNNGGHWVALVSLSSGNNNSVVAKYKGSDGSSVSWQNRYLSALKYANI